MNLAEALNHKWGKNRKISDERIKQLGYIIDAIIKTQGNGENEVGYFTSLPLIDENKDEFISLMKDLGFKVTELPKKDDEMGNVVIIEW